MYPHFTTRAATTLGHVLAWELNAALSRESVIVLAGDGADRSLALGTVLGKRLFTDPVIAAKQGGNTGDGALGVLALGDSCKVGVYVLTCVEAIANGGRFAVIDPDGYRLADAVVGVAYANPQIAFTVADGAADFAVGDAFIVTVDEGDGRVVALDPTATDGTQLAHGVLLAHVTAPDGMDVPSSASVTSSVLLLSGLIWPDGISAGDKAAAIARLTAKALVLSTSVVA